VDILNLRQELDSLLAWEKENGYHILRKEDSYNCPASYKFGDINPDAYVFQEGIQYRIRIPKDPTQNIECDLLIQEKLEHQGLRGRISGPQRIRKRKDISISEWAEKYREQIEEQRKLAESRSKSLGIASDVIRKLKS
jgi:hypothetical protein